MLYLQNKSNNVLILTQDKHMTRVAIQTVTAKTLTCRFGDFT